MQPFYPARPPFGPFSATAPARLLPPQNAPATLALDAAGAASPSPNWPPSNRSAASSSYQQLRQAHDALDHAFNPGGDEPDQLLFWLPVTKP